MAFYKRTKGNMGQYEDWWTLRTEGEQQVVTHSWSHIKLKGLETNEGQRSYTQEEFLSGDHDAGAQAALRALISQNSN